MGTWIEKIKNDVKKKLNGINGWEIADTEDVNSQKLKCELKGKMILLSGVETV